MILTDTFIVENAELLIEQRGGKTIRRLRGIFGRCDEKNNNGRVYSKHLLEREVKRIAEAMVERRLLGELDHPSHDAVKLSNVSHLITGLDFNGNDLMGECELLDTPAGKVAQALVEGGVKIGISSRGMGSLSEQADGTKTVNEDFRLVTFDLVADPSTRGAFPGITESTLVEEIVKDTLEKAAKEKVFTTMLKDKLREKIEGEGTQSAEWTKATVRELQKKANKKPEKPTVEEPFKNWEYWYGWNTGKPRLTRHRSYNDAESVTAPAEIAESKFCILRDVILEEGNDHSVGVLLELIKEAIKNQGAAFRNSRTPGAIKRALSGLAKSTGEKLIGKQEKIGGTSASLASRVGSSGMKMKQRYNSDTDRAGKAKAQTDGDKGYKGSGAAAKTTPATEPTPAKRKRLPSRAFVKQKTQAAVASKKKTTPTEHEGVGGKAHKEWQAARAKTGRAKDAARAGKKELSGGKAGEEWRASRSATGAAKKSVATKDIGNHKDRVSIARRIGRAGKRGRSATPQEGEEN